MPMKFKKEIKQSIMKIKIKKYNYKSIHQELTVQQQ